MKLRYFYDAQGICGFRYTNGNTTKDIIYVKNIFGDVEFLQDSSGNVLAQYVYDAWGNCSIIFDTNGIGALNPIRYRSYYYDVESRLYYLMTRYYDPETATFISPDTVDYLKPDEIGGIDLYAYCYHNPIMYYAPMGHFAVTLTIIGLIIGAIIGATIGGMIAYNIASSNGATGWVLAGWTILGILTGGIIGGALGAAVGALGGAIFPGINAALANGISFSVPTLANLGGVLGFEMVEVAVSGTVVSSVAVSGAVAAGALGSGLVLMAYNRKPIAPRIHCNSRKEAYEKAFLKGGKKKPIFHNGEFGKHFHPYGAKFKHWHYYFSSFIGTISLLFGAYLNDYD